jgi:hypothetical protein
MPPATAEGEAAALAAMGLAAGLAAGLATEALAAAGLAATAAAGLGTVEATAIAAGEDEAGADGAEPLVGCGAAVALLVEPLPLEQATSCDATSITPRLAPMRLRSIRDFSNTRSRPVAQGVGVPAGLGETVTPGLGDADAAAPVDDAPLVVDAHGVEPVDALLVAPDGGAPPAAPAPGWSFGPPRKPSGGNVAMYARTSAS